MQFDDNRKTILILYIGFFVFGLLSTVIGVTIPNIKHEFGISNEQAGLLFVYWSSGTLIGAYVGGKIFHVGRTRFLFSATSMASIVCLLLLYGEESLSLYKLYIFALSLSGSIFFTAGHATAAYVRNDSKASTLSFMDFLVSLGNLSTPFLVNAFVSTDGWIRNDWRFVFVVATALLIVATALVLTSNLDRLDAVKKAETVRIDYLSVITDPIFLVLMVTSFFLHATEWGHGVWFVTYANEVVGLSPEEARETFSLFLIGMACSRLLISWLTRMLQPITLMAILISAAVVAAASITAYQNPYALRVLNFMLGFGIGALFPLVLGLSMDRAPGQAQLLSGVGLMAGTIGAKSASYFIGLFADYSSLGETYGYVSWATIALLLGVLAFVSVHAKRSGARAAAPGPGHQPPAERDDALAGGAQREHQPLHDHGQSLALKSALRSEPRSELRFEFHFHPAAQGSEGSDQSDEQGHSRRRLLDVDLQRELERLFGRRNRLTREEALGFLSAMWDQYPLMRELYPSPAELLGAAGQGQEAH